MEDRRCVAIGVQCASCAASPSHSLHGIGVCNAQIAFLPALHQSKTAVATSKEKYEKLNERNIAHHNRHYNDLDASFDLAVRSRAIQEAGRQMGFNMRLECYEGEEQTLKAWVDSQIENNISLKEKILFKDSQDLRSMAYIAESFQAAISDSRTF